MPAPMVSGAMVARSDPESDDDPQDSGESGSLSPAQRAAIQLLVMGRTVAATAETLGVHRNTIFHWRRNNPRFRAELARRSMELFDTAARRVRLTLLKSLNVVDQWLERGEQGQKTALRFLAQMNLRAMVVPSEPM
ncbi:MAG: helix-turn-helix domain-containing protein, partial [Phycisphaerae bacterium]|nr:helix-turn-helix domain-containing protein [Phycisphaerae bacterium]